MQVLLIMSSPNRYPIHGEIQPLGVVSLASYLRSRGHTVQLVHQLYPQNPSDDYLVKLAGDYDVVGFSTYTTNIERSLTTARRMKTVLGNRITTIFGGPFSTGWPELEIESTVDYVVLGEGEHTTAELLECIETNGSPTHVKGIAFSAGHFIRTELRPRIQDLDSLPFPELNELPQEEYTLPGFSAIMQAEPAQMFTSLTSRGCPHNCSFCVPELMWNNQWIGRSVDHVMEEIEFRWKSGRRVAGWLDQDINIDQNRARSLYEAMIRSPYRIRWFGETSPASASNGLLARMQQSGCVGLLFGVESGSETMQKRIGKHTNLNRFREIARRMVKLDMLCVFSFIIGLPWEDRQTLKETRRYLRTLPVGMASFAYAEPYPGTPLWDIGLKEGWITRDLSIYNRSITSPVMPTYSLSKKDLEKMQWRLAISYLLSPGFLGGMLLKFLRRPLSTARFILALFFTARKTMPHDQ
ncbi:B12-binding domain-containing radical SAM protein [Thermodesulfobacteriota bacterium]